MSLAPSEVPGPIEGSGADVVRLPSQARRIPLDRMSGLVNRILNDSPGTDQSLEVEANFSLNPEERVALHLGAGVAHIVEHPIH